MSSRYPGLSAALARDISAIASCDGIYHPCSIVTREGVSIDRVYLAPAQPWFRRWGVWPENDPGKSFIDIGSVAQVVDSASRLPVDFADKLYRAGESGMGYTIFTVRFRNGASMVVLAGNAIDFIDYPAGQSAQTVIDVLPHVGRGDPHVRSAPSYAWCLYDE